MAECFAANTVSRFLSPKTGKKNQSCCKGVFLNQLPTKPNRRLKFFTNGGPFKDYGHLHKVQSLSIDLVNMDANTLNHWLSKFVQELQKVKGRCIQQGHCMKLSVASEGI